MPTPDHAAEPGWAGTSIEGQWVTPMSLSDAGYVFFTDEIGMGENGYSNYAEVAYSARFTGGGFAAPVVLGESGPASHDALWAGGPAEVAAGIHGQEVTWFSQGGNDYQHYVSRLAFWPASGGTNALANLPDANDCTLTLPAPLGEVPPYTFYNGPGYDDLPIAIIGVNGRGQIAAVSRESAGTVSSTDLFRPPYGVGPVEEHLLAWSSGAGAVPVSLAHGDQLPQAADLTGQGWLLANGPGGLGARLWLGDLNWKPKALPLAPVEGVDAGRVSLGRGNGRGQVIAYEATRGACLWQNGRLYSLDRQLARLPGWSEVAPMGINDEGVIFGQARFAASAPERGNGSGAAASPEPAPAPEEPRNVLLLPTPLVPDDPGQTNVKGAMVESIKGPAGQKHFVSPKKTGDVVVIRAQMNDAAKFDHLYEWMPLPGVTFVANKAMVSRDAAKRYAVQLKSKLTGQVVDTLNVWVVWAEFQTPAVVRTLDSFVDNDGPNPLLYLKVTHYKFLVNLLPSNLFTLSNDVPNLAGQWSYPVPGGPTLEGGAGSRWDVSRRKRLKWTDSTGAITFTSVAVTSNTHDGIVNGGNLPKAGPIVFFNYPSDPLIGNDDSNWSVSEDRDPYSNQQIIPETGTYPARGQIGSMDYPRPITIKQSALPSASDGSTLDFRMQFQEFARCQIGNGPGSWYLIFEPCLWQDHVVFIKSGGIWTDASEQILDNSDF